MTPNAAAASDRPRTARPASARSRSWWRGPRRARTPMPRVLERTAGDLEQLGKRPCVDSWERRGAGPRRRADAPIRPSISKSWEGRPLLFTAFEREPPSNSDDAAEVRSADLNARRRAHGRPLARALAARRVAPVSTTKKAGAAAGRQDKTAQSAGRHLRPGLPGRPARPRGRDGWARILELPRRQAAAPGAGAATAAQGLAERLLQLEPAILPTDTPFREPPAGGQEASPGRGLQVLEMPEWFVCQGELSRSGLSAASAIKKRQLPPTAAPMAKRRARFRCASSPPAATATCRNSPGPRSPHRGEEGLPRAAAAFRGRRLGPTSPRSR